MEGLIELGNYKKAGVFLSVLIVVGILFSQRSVNPDFSFPRCTLSNPVETSITFYVDENVKWKSELTGKISAAVQLSNKILHNSCVNLTRKTAEVRYIPVTNTLRSAASLHKELEKSVGESKISALRNSPLQQYVLILNNSHSFIMSEGIYGTTMMNLNDSFVILDEDFPLAVLEHELGHLAWAMHEREDNDHASFWINEQFSPENEDKVKPYAGGFKCLGYGTVMTYSDKIVPAYSSPEITNHGEPCGIEGFADNARVMQEYAQSLR